MTRLTKTKCTNKNLSKKMRRTKLSGVLEIQTDPPISTRRPDLMLFKKNRTFHVMDLGVLAHHIVKSERKRKDRHILGSCQKTGKTVKHERDIDTKCSWGP